MEKIILKIDCLVPVSVVTSEMKTELKHALIDFLSEYGTVSDIQIVVATGTTATTEA